MCGVFNEDKIGKEKLRVESYLLTITSKALITAQ